jgi:hypothetical protein
MNYLSVIPGVNVVPLSYGVWEVGLPADDVEYATFSERMIARAPHTGQYFIANSRRVHNLLTGYLQGEQSESWIRNIAHYQDGRRDMEALRHHYAGEKNLTRRISDAKWIQSTLHYKSEWALPFNRFLDSLQKMFTIFEEEDEPLMERAKVDELLTKVQNSSLSAAVAQLWFQLNTVGITITVVANHLNSAVSQTPDYQLAREISSTNTTNKQQGGRGGGRFNNPGGHGGGHGGRFGRGGGCGTSDRKTVSTNNYSPADWNKLSFKEHDKIRKERDKKGEQGGTKHSVGDLSVEQFTAMINTVKSDQATNNTESTKTNTTTQNNDAGNAFGGKGAAKRAKFS